MFRSVNIAGVALHFPRRISAHNSFALKDLHHLPTLYRLTVSRKQRHRNCGHERITIFFLFFLFRNSLSKKALPQIVRAPYLLVARSGMPFACLHRQAGLARRGHRMMIAYLPVKCLSSIWL